MARDVALSRVAVAVDHHRNILAGGHDLAAPAAAPGLLLETEVLSDGQGITPAFPVVRSAIVALSGVFVFNDAHLDY